MVVRLGVLSNRIRRTGLMLLVCVVWYLCTYVILTRCFSRTVSVKQRDMEYVVFVLWKGPCNDMYLGPDGEMRKIPAFSAFVEHVLYTVYYPLLRLELRLGTRYYEPFLGRKGDSGQLVFPR